MGGREREGGKKEDTEGISYLYMCLLLTFFYLLKNISECPKINTPVLYFIFIEYIQQSLGFFFTCFVLSANYLTGAVLNSGR